MSTLARGWLAMGVALMGAWGAGACAAPTSFEGNAKFPGGVDGCRRQCAARRLDFGSFIYIGEYSTACACKPPPGPQPAPLPAGPQSERSLLPEDQEAAVAAAVAGAELQRRRIEAQQAQAAQSGAIGAAVGAGLAR